MQKKTNKQKKKQKTGYEGLEICYIATFASNHWDNCCTDLEIAFTNYWWGYQYFISDVSNSLLIKLLKLTLTWIFIGFLWRYQEQKFTNLSIKYFPSRIKTQITTFLIAL